MQTVDLQVLDQESWSSRLAGTRPLGDAARVRISAEGLVLKWFRTGSLGRRSLRRFVANAAGLSRLGVPAPVCRECLCVPERGLWAVVYEHRPGLSLRLRVRAGEEDAVEELPDFVADIHGRGVDFRALHLGNVLRGDAGGFALVDVEGTRLRRRPLTLRRRTSNLRRLFRNREDADFWDLARREAFVEAYLGAAELSSSRAGRLRRILGI